MKNQHQNYCAHSRNRDGQRHNLLTHLHEVATKAATFAAPFGAGELAYYLGLWHDLGKFNPAFQEYLLAAEQNPHQHRRGPDHKAAGVRIALEQGLGPLALLLHGHHGGLQNKETLRAWYSKHQSATDGQLALATQNDELLPTKPLRLPEYAQPRHAHDLLELDLFLRLLFSALVDADFLDTEAHFRGERVAQRETDIEMTELWARFERNQQQLTTKNSPINEIRQVIYQASASRLNLEDGSGTPTTRHIPPNGEDRRR